MTGNLSGPRWTALWRLAMVETGRPHPHPEGLEALRVHGGLGVPIIKPEGGGDYPRMQWAEEAGPWR